MQLPNNQNIKQFKDQCMITKNPPRKMFTCGAYVGQVPHIPIVQNNIPENIMFLRVLSSYKFTLRVIRFTKSIKSFHPGCLHASDCSDNEERNFHSFSLTCPWSWWPVIGRIWGEYIKIIISPKYMFSSSVMATFRCVSISFV